MVAGVVVRLLNSCASLTLTPRQHICLQLYKLLISSKISDPLIRPSITKSSRMRCKRHVTDLSSSVGVCASCLRERLLSVIAAQSSSHQRNRSRNQLHAQLFAAAASSLEHHQQHNRKSDFDRLQSSKSELQAERILFPRSVSPYVLRARKLWDDGDEDEVVVPDRRFYSTPQIGQMTSERERRKHAHGHGGGRFSFFTDLFKPISDRSEFDLKFPPETKPSTSTSSSSFSWFSSIWRKHKSKPPKTSTTNTSERLPRRGVVMDRGMTPERMSCDEFDEPSSRNEFISHSCKMTPARGAKPSSNISGMAFCMSPLVRASPARLWNQKSVPSDVIGFSGEIRPAGNPHHLSTASSYFANRSRKLVDFGRASHHH